MKYLLIALTLVFGAFANVAYGAPFVDKNVKEFLASPGAKAQLTFPLFVTLKSSLSSSEGVDREEFILRLKKQNRESIQRLKQRFAFVQAGELESLWIANGLFISLSATQIRQLAALPEVQGIYWSKKPYQLKKVAGQDRLGAQNFTYGLQKLRVPEVRQQFPHLTGKGVRVGVLDTGIVTTHPDLKGKLKVFRNFSPAKDNSPKDEFGHGTHVSGTIAGGKSSGIAIGVAPEADLIVGRIFDGNGSSEREMILKAMEWMADPDGNPSTPDHAQVVNSSWSDDDPFNDREPQNEPFCQIIGNWLRVGMIPVFSAGNTGPSEGTINIPAGCPEAFSVGATEINDRSPHFSSTGPARWKNLDLMKPEVSAPGFHIKSASKDGDYEEMSGTSMSAPHVTGAFAILLQAYPNASALQVQSAMANGAKDLGDVGQDAVFGYGRVDIIKSLEILKGHTPIIH